MPAESEKVGCNPTPFRHEDFGTAHHVRRFSFEFDRENSMPPLEHLQPIVALIAGVLILIIPRLLNIIVAIYLIVVGLIGLGFLR